MLDIKLLDGPTHDHYVQPAIRQVAFDWWIANAEGYEYPCTILYQIDDRRKEIYSHGVSFHYGYDNPQDGFKYVKEILQEIVRELEGQVEFLDEPVIE
jgi:hypothetical protein